MDTNFDTKTCYESIKKMFKKEYFHKNTINEMLSIMGYFLNGDSLEVHIDDYSMLISECHYVWKTYELRDKKQFDVHDSVILNMMIDSSHHDEVIKMTNIKKIPNHHIHLRHLLKMSGIKSLYIVPIKYEGKRIGNLVIKYYRTKNQLSEKDIKFIQSCSDLLENYFNYKHSEVKTNMFKKEYLTILENLLYPTVLLDENYHFIYSNNQFNTFFHMTKAELDNLNFIEYIAESKGDTLISIIKDSINNIPNSLEVFKFINGQKKFIRIVPMPLQNEHFRFISLMFYDITEAKSRETNMVRMAYFDSTTKLYNRNYLRKACEDLENIDYRSLGVVKFDIDNLNLINNEFGHKKGDQLILTVSKIIQDTFNNEFLVSRIGGDEFIVFVINKSEETIVDKIEHSKLIMLQSLNKQQISIGYSYSSSTNVNINDLIHLADKKMHENKKHKNQHPMIEKIINRPII